ncbi:MAG: methyl-accepting chemotaxis protein, partial [Gemmatimonadales bacterium]
ILEDAIGAEELNKVHVREKVIAGNLSLQDSFAEMERLAHRLLDWGDMRVYRTGTEGPELIYRGTYGRDDRDEAIPELHELRNSVLRDGEPLIIPDAARDPRVRTVSPKSRSILIAPLTFGEEAIGTLELEHHTRHAYRQRDLEAVSTFANQLATAMHIADLRRPLVATVDRIGSQVSAFGQNIEMLRAATGSVASASETIRSAMGSQGRAMEGGLATTDRLAASATAMAAEGARAAESASAASEVARQSRETILDAVQRLVQLKAFVAGSSRQVGELGRVSQRITGFIDSIREIADLTNLIALNAAIEAARAGKQGQGFAVVADEVRQLASQSADASREAALLVATIVTQIEDIARQMERGESIVEGVEDISSGAADALAAIVRATDSAGSYGRQIADTAAEQETAFSRLRTQIADLTEVSARMLREAEEMASRATEANEGHAQMERAVRELEAVATHLHAIARTFSTGIGP